MNITSIHRCKLFGCLFNRKGKLYHMSYGEKKCCFFCNRKSDCPNPCLNHPEKCRQYHLYGENVDKGGESR